jgi:hypothetical protein
MICCSFVFRPGEYDEDFHRLDGEIDAFARSLPGFDRVDTWHSADGSVVNAMYFFEGMDSVRRLARFPQHLEAKRQVDRWYLAYRVDISEVTASYGDPDLRP